MGKNNQKLTTEEVINRFKKIHGDRYNYSLVDYKNSHSKVSIICNEHGMFQMRASHHYDGHGCKKCSDSKERYNTLSNVDFIERSNKIHKNKYDYSLSEYNGIHTKIKIICKIHGVFEQLPNNHFKKLGCPKCSGIKRLTNEEFIENSIKIHGNKYDYSLVNYKNNHTKIKIICKKHGVFEQTPSSHMNNGSGCPYCLNSKGESFIKNFLKKLNIKFYSQYKFNKCRDKYLLPFDFYLPDHKLCIEYDGKQHFQPIKRFGGEDNFILTQKHDKIKNEYCIKNNIHLLRISYKDNIEEKLKIINEKH